MSSEKSPKRIDSPSPHSPTPSVIKGTASPIHSEKEVFGTGGGDVNFRNVSSQRAAIFMLKMTFATGVLSLPPSLNSLGAVAGAIFIFSWGVVNAYMAVLQGQFKLRHPSLHTVADGAHITTLDLSGGSKRWAAFAMEVTEFLYLVSWILCTGLTVLGIFIALNAVSDHGTCTVAFAFVSYLACAILGRIRKIEKTAWVSWFSFFSIVAAIFIILIGTVIRDRAAAAPETGDFNLGFRAFPLATTSFTSAYSAALIIYASSANTSGYIPIIP